MREPFKNVSEFYEDLVSKGLIGKSWKTKKEGLSKIIVYTNKERIALLTSIADAYRRKDSKHIVTYDVDHTASTVGALVSATPQVIAQRRATRGGHPLPTIIFKPTLRNSRAWESAAVSQINSAIGRASTKTQSSAAVVRIAGNNYYVFYATLASQSGAPKADITLHGWTTKEYKNLTSRIRSSRKPEIVWVSHKSGTTANDFQNWGGISERTEHAIANKKATKEFVEKITETLAENPAKQGDLYTMEITDPEVKYMSVFGRDWRRGSRRYGANKVNVVLQGNIDLEETGAIDPYLRLPVFRFKATHVIENFGTVGSFYPFDNKTSDYNAVFAMRYASDRSNAKLPNARLGIYPQGWRQAKTKGTKLD